MWALIVLKSQDLQVLRVGLAVEQVHKVQEVFIPYFSPPPHLCSCCSFSLSISACHSSPYFLQCHLTWSRLLPTLCFQHHFPIQLESVSPSLWTSKSFVLTSPVAKSYCPSYSHLCSCLISPSSQYTPQWQDLFLIHPCVCHYLTHVGVSVNVLWESSIWEKVNF